MDGTDAGYSRHTLTADMGFIVHLLDVLESLVWVGDLHHEFQLPVELPWMKPFGSLGGVQWSVLRQPIETSGGNLTSRAAASNG